MTEAEGAFLSKVKLLFILVAAAAISASGLGVTAAMSATVMERRIEIGLMRALGADHSQIAKQFMLEAALIGLVAGVAGSGVGAILSAVIGNEVFDGFTGFNIVIVPAAVLISLTTAIIGSAIPVLRAIRIDPVKALKS